MIANIISTLCPGNPKARLVNGIAAHRQSDAWATHGCGISCHDGALAAGSNTVCCNDQQLCRIGDSVRWQPAAALSVLAQVPRWEDCPYVSVFTSWNTARKQAGLSEVQIHDLRHSFASNCINQQVSIYEVSKLLGHAQVSTTARYSHLSRETLLAAVEASGHATGADCGQAQTVKAGENLALVAPA